MKTAYPAIAPFVTKDGSIIRELIHPLAHGNHAQSLAEAIVPPRSATLAHRHQLSEEIYHFIAGQGRMRLGEDEFSVSPGDTVCIPPGTPHALINPHDSELRLLCCSSPAYAHDDTEILQS
ncbi:MAG: cupin domain-containing protein [Pseudomonadota bacterium]